MNRGTLKIGDDMTKETILTIPRLYEIFKNEHCLTYHNSDYMGEKDLCWRERGGRRIISIDGTEICLIETEEQLVRLFEVLGVPIQIKKEAKK